MILGTINCKECFHFGVSYFIAYVIVVFNGNYLSLLSEVIFWLFKLFSVHNLRNIFSLTRIYVYVCYVSYVASCLFGVIAC